MYKVFGYDVYATLAALTRINTHDGLPFRTTVCGTPHCSALIKISQPVEHGQMQPCFCKHSRDIIVIKNDGRKASHQPINSPVMMSRTRNWTHVRLGRHIILPLAKV